MTHRVEAVPADRWDESSPCEGWTARDVLRHIIDTESEMVARVDVQVAPGPSVDDDPIAAWRHTRDEIQGFLDDPAIAGREYDGMGGRDIMANPFASYYAVDLVVHGWDIARATGTDETIDADDLAVVWRFIDGMSEEMKPMLRAPQVFGPELDPPDGADDQTKLLAFLGRRC